MSPGDFIPHIKKGRTNDKYVRDPHLYDYFSTKFSNLFFKKKFIQKFPCRKIEYLPEILIIRKKIKKEK